VFLPLGNQQRIYLVRFEYCNRLPRPDDELAVGASRRAVPSALTPGRPWARARVLGTVPTAAASAAAVRSAVTPTRRRPLAQARGAASAAPMVVAGASASAGRGAVTSVPTTARLQPTHAAFPLSIAVASSTIGADPSPTTFKEKTVTSVNSSNLICSYH
jgi:hypothetical protein